VLVYAGIIVGTIAGVGPLYNWGFLAADGMFGLGCVVLGYGLWSRRDEPVQAAQPAR